MELPTAKYLRTLGANFVYHAEEKRIKWGTDEFKLELIKEMSSANIALFIDEHLKTISEPSRIYYKFSKESTREDSFNGNVVAIQKHTQSPQSNTRRKQNVP